jgi:hypothetical protein
MPNIIRQRPAEKPGYKTTEFWLSLLAMLLGALMSSGVLGGASDNGVVNQIVGAILVALSQMGYAGSRAAVKKAA